MNNDTYENRTSKYRLLLNSTTLALLLSVGFFSYEMINSTKETDQIVQNLMEIQGSLSTRYLGLFPEYIDNINNLLNNTIEDQCKSEIQDTVIIFEDVLYYGIRSDAEGFRKMVENLVTLTNNGCHIIIAFYDENSIPFKQMIRDKLIGHEYKKRYRDDMNSYRQRVNQLRQASSNLDQDMPRIEFDDKMKGFINTYFDNYLINNPNRAASLPQVIRNIYSYQVVDSILSQYYYEVTYKNNPKKIEATIKSLLHPLPKKENAVDATSLRVNQLCAKLDNIKQHYMDKPHQSITYFDFYNMYKEISNAICSLYRQQPNIELLPMSESHMMCCWMSSVNGKDQAIFAFPSKYSTDEIGFISQDVAIARYIRTMLKGVKESHSNIQ